MYMYICICIYLFLTACPKVPVAFFCLGAMSRKAPKRAQPSEASELAPDPDGPWP